MMMKKVVYTFAALLMITGMVAGQSAMPDSNTAATATSDNGRPQARSEQEREDYLTASAAAKGAALEAAANDFAARYPESELRVYLYAQSMLQFQTENDAPRLLAAAQKVLALSPNHSVALALSALALADNLEATDPDRANKVEEIKRRGNRAIHGVQTGYAPPASATPEQAAQYRRMVQSLAYSALGIMRLKTGDDAGAEKDLINALALNKIRPDPYLWYHLALAQDHRRQYSAALNSVEQALQLASSNPELQKLAEIEHDRLSGLAGRAPRSSNNTGAGPPQ
jgi:tetratricopeptide (TPR) repeat protein